MADDQTAVIRFLSMPASYGVTTPVERIDTHCSIVFLAGDRAYKLKRAVTYSYLDYSRLELRKHACERELILNRRTAPALYLRIQPITRTANGRLTLGGDGAALDWVLVMTRFSEEDLFDRMAASGRLSSRIMRQLADAIARFHATAEMRRDHGGGRAIVNVIQENDDNLRTASPPLENEKIAELHSKCDRTLVSLRDLLDRRRTEGKVRQCHGDLHLRNICLFDGRPTLFDCIEFRDELACIDVLYDLAFLLMDLHHRSHSGLASVVFNRYMDMSAETEGVAALPLFLCLRAAIRAHVMAASAAKQDFPAERKSEMQQAVAYLDLALEFLVPAKPLLVAIGGLSGSGKSAIGAGIAPDFKPVPGARVIRSDVMRKRLMGQAPEQHLPASAYTEEMNRRVYETMLAEAACTLASGYTAIVDATFLGPTDRLAPEMLARRANVPFLGLWLDAPPDKLRERIAARCGDASDADVRVLDQQLCVDPGQIGWHRIEVFADYANCLEATKRLLNSLS